MRGRELRSIEDGASSSTKEETEKALLINGIDGNLRSHGSLDLRFDDQVMRSEAMTESMRVRAQPIRMAVRAGGEGWRGSVLRTARVSHRISRGKFT